MSNNALIFMGMQPEDSIIRCRIYDGISENGVDKRLAFLRTCSSDGAVDCPAYDPMTARRDLTSRAPDPSLCRSSWCP